MPVLQAQAKGGTVGTVEFAEFISQTKYEDLPAAAVTAIKSVIVDTLAVTVAGVAEPTSEVLSDLLSKYGGASISTVIGRPFKTDPASAALLNGTAAHVLDYDDYCFAMSGHPSAVILPPILALAESLSSSGRDLIKAYAVGFETAIMISHVINPDHYGHGWHGTGTVGAMGATGAAASLLGLSVEQVGSALAMGASSAAGLRRNFGSDVKSYHAGNAARAGVMAAELAARGFVGSDEILESKYGFYNVMTPGNGVPRTRPNRGFGDPWNTLDPGITTKLFPSCGSTHASIGSILVLREAHGLRPEDIKQVDARVTDISYGNLQYPRPRTGLEGKFSMQYCLARALVDGWLGIDDFTDDAVLEDRIQELIPRINLHHDQDLTDAYVWGAHRPAVVTVETVSGDVLTHRTDAPPGSPGNFTREMLVNKVRDCISRGAIVGKADDVLDAIDHLDEVANISNLMKMMSGL